MMPLNPTNAERHLEEDRVRYIESIRERAIRAETQLKDALAALKDAARNTNAMVSMGFLKYPLWMQEHAEIISKATGEPVLPSGYGIVGFYGPTTTYVAECRVKGWAGPRRDTAIAAIWDTVKHAKGEE